MDFCVYLPNVGLNILPKLKAATEKFLKSELLKKYIYKQWAYLLDARVGSISLQKTSWRKDQSGSKISDWHLQEKSFIAI